jgi:hypothetical protein
LIEQQPALAIATQTNQVALKTRVQNRLDRVEGMNAAKWGEDFPIYLLSAPARKSVSGLSSPRYAVLVDKE